MQKKVYQDHTKLSEAVAELIAEWIINHKGELLCFAALQQNAPKLKNG